MAERAVNFCAGPAALPAPVLERIREDLPVLGDSGVSVMELGHRSQRFAAIATAAEAALRRLLGIPARYRVLFLHGGATAQFTMVPLNLARAADRADYVVTGYWGRKAAAEAARYLRLQVAADGVADGYRAIPARAGWSLDEHAAYVHVTLNETIHGLEFEEPPAVPAQVPLVADASSSLLTAPLDVTRFGLLYASAQKNLGIAGLTVVIVDESLLERGRPERPATWQYDELARAGSLLNTPNCFAWYVAGLVFEWIEAQGGLERMAELAGARARLLYDALDRSSFYEPHVPAGSAGRSRVNVPFRLADRALEAAFLHEAQAAGLLGLAGHRSLGGIRASLYNAMPLEGVERLVAFMDAFERRHG